MTTQLTFSGRTRLRCYSLFKDCWSQNSSPGVRLSSYFRSRWARRRFGYEKTLLGQRISAVLLGLSRRIKTILSFTQTATHPNIGRVYGDSGEIASSTNACGIGLRCLGSNLVSRASGETPFLSVIPVYRTTGRSLHSRTRPKTRGRYRSPAYSALAALYIGMSDSASCQNVKKS